MKLKEDLMENPNMAAQYGVKIKSMLIIFAFFFLNSVPIWSTHYVP
jgi:hypothetical protein